MLPTSINWLSVMKWIGALAAFVAVIGVPIWYMNNRIDAAFEQGKEVGKAECQAAANAEAAQDLARAADIIDEEAKKAREAEKKNVILERDTNILKELLEAELRNLPPVVGCIANRNVTSLLRSAAEGDFSAEGTSVPGQLDPKVPRGTSVPGEGGIKSS